MGQTQALHSCFELEGCEGVGRERLWEKPVPHLMAEENKRLIMALPSEFRSCVKVEVAVLGCPS